ncbi:MAG: ribosome recycling factor [Nitrospiraceae bacterium]|nr:ribosome recycling factor [Nitrospiraceae bacterium]
MEGLLKDGEKRMKKTIDTLRGDLSSIRTGRASTVLVENIKVDYYGKIMPLKQLAQLSVSGTSQISIQPWDPSAIPSIEKALRQSDLGTQPQRDGNVIRLNLPSLTQERRKELAKKVRKMAEEAKIAIRNIRHDIIKEIEHLKENGHSEDEAKRFKEKIQKLTDRYTNEIDKILSQKEKEILTT